MVYGCWTKNRGDFTPKMDGENIKIHDLGVSLFLETPINGPKVPSLELTVRT